MMYQITDDGPEDGSANIVEVYEAVKPGDAVLRVTASDKSLDDAEEQCLIDRSLTIADDLTITQNKAASLENLFYKNFGDSLLITKAHPYISGNVVLPDNVISIPEEFLKYSENVTSVTLPESIARIPQSAFELCYGLESITILNPKCKIFDDHLTITNNVDEEWNISFNGVIRGFTGSTAENYAKKHGYDFRPIDADGPGGVEIIEGDANCDGKVTIADAAAILQFLGNGDKYSLTEQGRLNADCDGVVGITTDDARKIQLMAVKQ